MEIRILGSLEVWDGPRQIEIGGPKRRALLGLLVLHANEVVGKERLIDELWGEDAPRTAAASLHNHISRLRKSLGPDRLRTRAWGYALRVEPNEVDLQRFERLVADAEPLPAKERSARLAEALGLWRGPALADLTYEPALSQEAARLEELRLTALETRLDADLEIGRSTGLVPELEALIAKHPLRERLRGQLILALYRDGRQAEALEVYRETRRLLADELGLEPSPALRELERAILLQDPNLVPAPREETSNLEPVRSRWRWPRSPFVAVAALLLLAGGGLATALTLGHSGASYDAQAARVPPIDTFSPQTVSSSSTGETSNRSTSQGQPATKPKANSSLIARHIGEGLTTLQAHRPATHSARGPQDRHDTVRPSTRGTKPKPAKTHTSVPTTFWLADNFNDPVVDYGLWNVNGHGTGVQAAERNGRLEFSVLPDVTTDGVYGADQHYGTNCRLTGNFDAEVDYTLLSWPASDGASVTFGAWFPPLPGVLWSISRLGQPAGGGSEAYVSSIGSSTGWVQTGDSSGELRINRVRGVLTTYYRFQRSWVKLASGYEPGPAGLVLLFGTNGDQFGHQAASAAFDNFHATATSVDCPGAPLPPRRRAR